MRSCTMYARYASVVVLAYRKMYVDEKEYHRGNFKISYSFEQHTQAGTQSTINASQV